MRDKVEQVCVLLRLAKYGRQEIGDEQGKGGFHRRVDLHGCADVGFHIAYAMDVAVRADVGDALKPLQWLAYGPKSFGFARCPCREDDGNPSVLQCVDGEY